MKRIFIKKTGMVVSVVSVVSFFLISCSSLLSETILVQEGFDGFELGEYANKQFSNHWNNVRWVDLGKRLSVIEDREGGRVLRVAYPEGGVGPKQTGSQFVLNLPPANEYELSYKVKFEEGFDFRIGGKLPGLTSGAEKFTGGHHPLNGEGWSARFMWREEGTVELYLYYVDNKSKWGDQYVFEGIVLKPGRWYEFRQHIKLNAPQAEDGHIQAWIDGKSVLDLKGVRLRIGDQGHIDSFYFSTFHGGQKPEWAPRNDSFVQFDDLRITTR